MKKELKKNKHGFVQDILFFGIIIFILAIIVITGSKLSTDLTDNYNTTTASSNSKNLMTDMNDRYTSIFDWIFLTVFVLFALAIFASVFMLNTHPALFFVIIIVFGIVLIVIAMIGNAFETFKENPNVAGEVVNFSVINLIMDSWTIWLLVIGVIAIVLLFAKGRS